MGASAAWGSVCQAGGQGTDKCHTMTQGRGCRAQRLWAARGCGACSTYSKRSSCDQREDGRGDEHVADVLGQNGGHDGPQRRQRAEQVESIVPACHPTPPTTHVDARTRTYRANIGNTCRRSASGAQGCNGGGAVGAPQHVCHNASRAHIPAVPGPSPHSEQHLDSQKRAAARACYIRDPGAPRESRPVGPYVAHSARGV